MATDVPFDVTMDCTKCKKALCDRIQERFNKEMDTIPDNLSSIKASRILDRIIKEELAE